MDLYDYRNSAREQQRVADLMALLPDGLRSALDIGARDGFLSRLLADRIGTVTALDLTLPQIDDSRIQCVKGDIAALDLADGNFDLVFCAEVLEHIPPPILAQACRELMRVSNRYLIIGVPYRQDTRLGRTTCQSCGRSNPPWGHVNSFDERRLHELFADCAPVRTSWVGATREATNPLSSTLMEFAGNPFGSYVQDEPCVHCGQPLGRPRPRSTLQRVATRLAVLAQAAQQPFIATQGNWIHILFQKR